MLDIKLFRETPDLIMESERKRFRDTTNVDKVIEYDHKWREAIHELNMLRNKRNQLSESFKNARKNKNEQGNAELKRSGPNPKSLAKDW
jgi:seryl-tRNA synthetase